MSILTSINFLSNLIIFTSVFMFIISVFGRADHPIWETKWKAYLAKIGLCISGCGALLNMIHLSTPVLSEIVLNVGLSLNFLWISIWQIYETKKKSVKSATNKTLSKLPIKEVDLSATIKKQQKVKPKAKVNP
jgi:hypothetical protein